MPIPVDLLRVHLNFDLGNEEIAVATFHLQLVHEAGAPTDWAQMSQDAAQKTLDKWTSNMSGQAAAAFATCVKLRDVAAYHLNASNGLTLDKGSAVPVPATRWSGSGGTALPFEVACVVSKYGYTPGTFVADRARRRGRMYLPPLASSTMDAGLGRDGRFAFTSAFGPMVNGIGAFFNDVQGMTVGADPLAIGQTWDVVVVSRVGNMANRVQTVRVGDVPDAQRRRRNKQHEIYSDRVITA